MLALSLLRRNRVLRAVEPAEFRRLPLLFAVMAAVSVFQLGGLAILDRNIHLDSPARPAIVQHEAIAAPASSLTTTDTRITRPDREPDI